MPTQFGAFDIADILAQMGGGVMPPAHVPAGIFGARTTPAERAQAAIPDAGMPFFGAGPGRMQGGNYMAGNGQAYQPSGAGSLRSDGTYVAATPERMALTDSIYRGIQPFTLPGQAAPDITNPAIAAQERNYAQYMGQMLTGAPTGAVLNQLANDPEYHQRLNLQAANPAGQAALIGAGTGRAAALGFNGIPGAIQNDADRTRYQTSPNRLGDAIIGGMAATGTLTRNALGNLSTVLPNIGNLLGAVGRNFAPPATVPAGPGGRSGGGSAGGDWGPGNNNPVLTPTSAQQQALIDQFTSVARRNSGTRQPGADAASETWVIPEGSRAGAITDFALSLPDSALTPENFPETQRFMIDRFGGPAMDQWFTQRMLRGSTSPTNNAIQRMMRALRGTGVNVGSGSLNQQSGAIRHYPGAEQLLAPILGLFR